MGRSLSLRQVPGVRAFRENGGIFVFDSLLMRAVSVEEDGFLRNVKLGRSPLVLVGVNPAEGSLVFNVDGRFNVIPKKAKVCEMGHVVFEQKIAVKERKDDGVWYTDYPMNHIRMLIPDELQGRFYLLAVGVVAQDEKAFLVHQVESHFCYKDEGRVISPPFSEKGERYWPQLHEKIVEMFGDNKELPAVGLYEEEEKPPTDDLGPTEGRVCWWDNIKGIGCIYMRNEVVRAYWRAVKTRDRFKGLQKGEKVIVENMGPCGDSRSSFKKEALSLSLKAKGV